MWKQAYYDVINDSENAELLLGTEAIRLLLPRIYLPGESAGVTSSFTPTYFPIQMIRLWLPVINFTYISMEVW
jgi:hypothetical protein